MNSANFLLFILCGTTWITGCSTVPTSHAADAAPMESPRQALDFAEPAATRTASAETPTDPDDSAESTHNAATTELSFQSDWHDLVPDLWRDAESLCTLQNAVFLLAAGGASLAFRETLDDDVADNTARHANRWGRGDNVIGGFGNPAHHFAAIGLLYAYSLHNQDEQAHELSQTMFSAVALTGLSTMLLKATFNTTAPSGEPDPFGGSWPSGHTSSSFAMAAVLDEYYGHRLGLPAYVLAGLVGWERIDDREHDLSDVIFGAALGYVIGKTVAAGHHTRFCGMELEPYIDPAHGTTGLGLGYRY